MTQALDLVELDAEDPAAVDAAYRILNDATAPDLPDFPPVCRYAHEMQLRHPFPANEHHAFLAHRAGEPVGLVQIDLPVYDNLDKAHVEVSVPGSLRRQGIGRTLYTHAVDLIRAKGRTSVLGFGVLEAMDGAPIGGAGGFAKAVGQESKLTDVRRRLDLSTVDDAELDRLLDEGWSRAKGYSAVQWGLFSPDELLADIAALDSSFLEETPLGELDYEPEKVDPDRLRKHQEARAKYGARAYQTGLIDDATGRLVAWTAIRVAKTVDWHAWQLITLVHPQHRGHRLGIVAKLVNLATMRAEEPAVRMIDTFNAEVNSHMIAINEAMGFRAKDRWANWQTSVA